MSEVRADWRTLASLDRRPYLSDRNACAAVVGQVPRVKRLCRRMKKANSRVMEAGRHHLMKSGCDECTDAQLEWAYQTCCRRHGWQEMVNVLTQARRGRVLRRWSTMDARLLAIDEAQWWLLDNRSILLNADLMAVSDMREEIWLNRVVDSFMQCQH